MSEWLPGTARDAEARHLDAEMLRLTSVLEELSAPGRRRVLVLHGPPGAGKSTLARRLATELAASLDIPLHWLALGYHDAEPEQLLLRVLQRAGEVPPRELSDALRGGHHRLAPLAYAASQNWPKAIPSLFVLDALPGENLLRLTAELLRRTRHILIVTARTSHVAWAEDPDIVLHEVATPDGFSPQRWVAERHAQLTEYDTALLDALVSWRGTELSPDMPLYGARSTASDRRRSIERLHEHQLLQQTRPGWYELRPTVREEVARYSVRDRRRISEQMDRRLARCLVDEPGELGEAARVIGRLLGYLDTHRTDPAAPPVLANRDGQYLHLVGHSFGCRLLCEAVQWSAREEPLTLGWSTPSPAGRPFTVDSMLLLQMAAPRDAFANTFTALAGAPLRGPVVATYSQHDRATGFWHLRAEKRAGIGYAGIGTAPAPVSTIRMLSPDEPYPLAALDHRFVSVDASDVFVRGHGPAGAHSDHLRPESAHLLLSLADHCR